MVFVELGANEVGSHVTAVTGQYLFWGGGGGDCTHLRILYLREWSGHLRVCRMGSLHLLGAPCGTCLDRWCCLESDCC